MRFIQPISDLFARFERPISSLALFLGFIFDLLTIKRVDTLFENIFIAGYLVIIGICIVLIHLKESEAVDEKNPGKAHFWHINILQFCFGGVFSAYLILYFRSADILVAWPFVVFLAVIFVANEFLKQHYIRLSFQISLFFIAIYSFAIFFLPVVLHKIGAWVFLASGLASLAFITLFVAVLFYFIKHKFSESKKIIFFSVLSIFGLVNFLYFTNLIPPIPLSLKDAGVYHSLSKNQEGNYDVTYEDHGWRGYFRPYHEYKKTPGSPLFAYSAIFSPKGLNITIVHEWQRYDELKGGWVTETVIHLPVIGGRDGGFRTYSVRSNLVPGKWRVKIKTEGGQTIGHLRFSLVLSDTEPALVTGVKQ